MSYIQITYNENNGVGITLKTILTQKLLLHFTNKYKKRWHFTKKCDIIKQKYWNNIVL